MKLKCGNCKKEGKIIEYNELYRCEFCNSLNYKPRANQSLNDFNDKKVSDTIGDMTIKEFVNIKEIYGFNYIDYLIKILEVLKTDKFADLKAITEKDINDGLLPESEINKLRLVLKNGFKNNKTINQIEKEIKENITLRDRITESGVVIGKESRPNMIARTETVRLANEGLKELYKVNNITKVRWLAALSDRTCPLCENLNGQVFEISNLNVGVNQPPLHTSCRCSLVSVVE